jgi:hypothetical protein
VLALLAENRDSTAQFRAPGQLHKKEAKRFFPLMEVSAVPVDFEW